MLLISYVTEGGVIVCNGFIFQNSRIGASFLTELDRKIAFSCMLIKNEMTSHKGQSTPCIRIQDNVIHLKTATATASSQQTAAMAATIEPPRFTECIKTRHGTQKKYHLIFERALMS